MNKNINKKGWILILSFVMIGVLGLNACTPISTSSSKPTSIVPTADPNIPIAVIPTPAAGEPAATAHINNVIYSGPGTNYVMYATFLTGSTAKVVGKSQDGKWWAISVTVAPTGAGWVDAAAVTASQVDAVPVLPTPPVPPTTEMIPPGPNAPQAMTIASVDIRSGPAANYPAYGIVRAYTTGRVIGKSEDGAWWVVRINPAVVGAGYGWVMAQYTVAKNVANVQTIQNPDTYAPVPPAPPPSGVPAAMAIDYVNVRTGPGTNYPVLGVAPPGASAEVSGKSADGGWWQVKVPTQYSSSGFGWVSASYVTTQNTGSVAVVEVPPPPPPVESTPPPSSNTGCLLTSQSPTDYTQFTAGSGFSTTWVLQNTGSTAWGQYDTDVRYVGAVNNIILHQGSDVYDLTTDVQPGATYNFTVSMIAPFDADTYGEMWEINVGNGLVCQFYVYIVVPTSGVAPTPSNTPPAPTTPPTAPTNTPPPTAPPAAPTNTPPAPTAPPPTATKPPATPTTLPPTATIPPPPPTPTSTPSVSVNPL